MDRMLYVAMSGARQIMLAQAANSNNLANVSTSGFRADLSQFRSQPVFGNGYPTRVYAMAERPGVDFKPGINEATGRDLDVAIKGKGWIAVQDQTGKEAYTRDGSLRITANGLLQTSQGDLVIGNTGPIAIPPAEKIEIAHDGTISIQPKGQGPETLAVLDRIKLVNPSEANLQKGPDGLMRTASGIQPPDAAVQLRKGVLEHSNVSAVGALVRMIELSRQYEMNIKMMSAARDMEQQNARMLALA